MPLLVQAVTGGNFAKAEMWMLRSKAVDLPSQKFDANTPAEPTRVSPQQVSIEIGGGGSGAMHAFVRKACISEYAPTCSFCLGISMYVCMNVASLSVALPPVSAAVVVFQAA